MRRSATVHQPLMSSPAHLATAWRQAAGTVALAVGLLLSPASLLAQTRPATQAADPLPLVNSVLSQLGQDTVQHQAEIRQDLLKLQQHLRKSLVRVQIPLGRAPTAPTSRPMDSTSVPTGAGSADVGPESSGPTTRTAPMVVLTGLALILDTDGHILVPEFVEPAPGSTSLKIKVETDAGGVYATFVAADRPTRVSIFKLDDRFGQPAQEAFTTLPPDGALIFVVPSNDPNAHLGFWNAGTAENGWIASVNGQIYGLSRQGRLFSLKHMTQISTQLVENHTVKRAQLGVMITELPPDAPERKEHPELGNRPAILVLDVVPNSPAAQAGLKPGDLILALDGQSVADRFGFAAAIAAIDGGVPFGIYRDGQEKTVQVTLHSP